MLLDLAESLTPLLKARHDRVTSQQGILRDGFDEEESSDTTLTILFLDGEEAFHDWTDTDSIYGARHLSQLWQDTYPEPDLGKRRYDPISTYIETIDHFILLDLLGNSHSRLHSYYRPGMIGDDHLPVCPFFHCCPFLHSSILSDSQFVPRLSAFFFCETQTS
jgi:glutaminyl-peptide cyclotransferase